MRRRTLLALLVIGMTAVAACGGASTGSTTTTTTSGGLGTVPTTTAPAVTTTTAAAASTTEAATTEPCDPTITQITADEPYEGMVTGVDQPTDDRRGYFCVELPAGLAEATFTLTGMTANLDLYVGYPDMDTLQNGGLALRWSTNDGTADESVSAPHFGSEGIIRAGSWYIEVSAADFRDSSPFTLTVTTEAG